MHCHTSLTRAFGSRSNNIGVKWTVMKLQTIPLLLALLSLSVVNGPATAQLGQSNGYKFLQAIRDGKGDEVTKLLNEPGTTVINTKDYSSGETALHIVAKRGDPVYTRFLLQRGANPNIRDVKGNTPLLVAVSAGAEPLVSIFIVAKANANIPNQAGETPLIRAVQRRDIAMVRELLAAGADPDQADSLAGMSARDYAQQDTRTPAIAKLIAETPKRDRRAVAGPTL
jgi:ankyrin repeat protein